MDSKWIHFEERLDKPQLLTKQYYVLSNDNNFVLGQIKWYGAWRTYAFYPSQDTVFEPQCLGDITRFINKLMLDRKIEKQNQKQKDN